jgi:hypothetical protein
VTVRWLLTSAVIEIGTYQAVVTAADFRFVVSAPAPTPVPAGKRKAVAKKKAK